MTSWFEACLWGQEEQPVQNVQGSVVLGHFLRVLEDDGYLLQAGCPRSWKDLLFLVGMVVFRSISRVYSPSFNSRTTGLRPKQDILNVAFENPPWIAAPIATTSSGFTHEDPSRRILLPFALLHAGLRLRLGLLRWCQRRCILHLWVHFCRFHIVLLDLQRVAELGPGDFDVQMFRQKHLR